MIQVPALRAAALAATLCLATAALTGASAPAQAQTKARLSYHWNPDHESAIMSAKFAKLVNERSGGKIQVEGYPSGQLFSIRQITGALSSGSRTISVPRSTRTGTSSSSPISSRASSISAAS
jgi:TRAP-type C4-dicarboxylate transport system substrate-binding protein